MYFVIIIQNTKWTYIHFSKIKRKNVTNDYDNANYTIGIMEG